MTRAHIYRYYLAIHKKTEIILTSFLRTPNENKQTNKHSSVSRPGSIRRTVKSSDQDQGMGHACIYTVLLSI